MPGCKIVESKRCNTVDLVAPFGDELRQQKPEPEQEPEQKPNGSQNSLCKNCKRPGHFARECPNVAICHNCGLPGHIASECTTKSLCWNCREPGHMAGNCPNEGICHTCGKAGHRARDCTAPQLPPGDLRLCNNCFKQGHMAADCTNDKACKNCRKTGHLARDCQNEPVCNLCNISGHVARDCPKANMLEERGGGVRGGGFRDIVCRNCQQVGHMSRDCISMTICHNCGGRGHLAFECPSGRFMDRFPRSAWGWYFSSFDITLLEDLAPVPGFLTLSELSEEQALLMYDLNVYCFMALRISLLLEASVSYIPDIRLI
ncbi:hypothetical protein Sango_0889600 [Sesamum angolense]|uniref:CCHC-type domain-containing protein n=1 Tax=Sesamum angolense TaxID=2727404 RepID=A0AAE1WYB4_9LAMI|nr:hypothetical protein Sango_0889600 [Sesamum angolense]